MSLWVIGNSGVIKLRIAAMMDLAYLIILLISTDPHIFMLPEVIKQALSSSFTGLQSTLAKLQEGSRPPTATQSSSKTSWSTKPGCSTSYEGSTEGMCSSYHPKL